MHVISKANRTLVNYVDILENGFKVRHSGGLIKIELHLHDV